MERHWRDLFQVGSGLAAVFALAVDVLLVVLFFVRPSYEWMRRRTSKWALAAVVNLMMVFVNGCMVLAVQN